MLTADFMHVISLKEAESWNRISVNSEVTMKYTLKNSATLMGGGVLILFAFIFALTSCDSALNPPPEKYTVSFLKSEQESQPDEMTLPSSETIEEGLPISAPETPTTVEGWTFIGWSSDSNIYKAFDFTAPITGDTSIYAFWKNEALDEYTDSAGTYSISWNDSYNGYSVGKGSFNNKLNPSIPAYVNGIPVVAISPQAFSTAYDLSGTFTIPNTVKYVGEQLFYSADAQIDTIVYGAGIEKIASTAFSYCDSLKNISYANGVPKVLGGFYNVKSLEGDLVIPEGVERIDDQAFFYCKNITSISIPSSVKEIGSGAFSGCGKVTAITFAASDNGYILEDSKTQIDIYDSDLAEEGWTDPELEDQGYGAGYVRFNCGVFEELDSLTTINNADAITYIGSFAFKECEKLTNVDFSNPNLDVGRMAFFSMSNTQNIEFSGTKDDTTWHSSWDSKSEANFTFGK